MNQQKRRALKRISIKASALMPNINWTPSVESKTECDYEGALARATPIVVFKATEDIEIYRTVCAWALLKRLFMVEQTASKEWYWGKKPTAENVLLWAYWSTSIENMSIDDLTKSED